MKVHNKKILSLAIAAALSGVSVGAHAVVNLSTSTSGVKFASELPTTGLTLANGTTTGGTDLTFQAVPTTFTPSAGQNLQVTVTLSTGATFDGNPNLVCQIATATTAATNDTAVGILNLGGNGTNQAVFTLSQTAIVAGTTGATSGSIISACTVSASGIAVASGAHSNINASITYQYGNLSSSTVSTAIITFAKGVSAWTTGATTVQAMVTAGFTTFTDTSTTTAGFGNVYYQGNGSARLDSTGLKASATDNLTSASITLGGAAGALAAAMTGGVFLVTAAAACTASTAQLVASANGGTSVTFGSTAGVTVAQLVTGYKACLTVNGTTSIPADSITASVAGNVNTGYSAVTTIASNVVGTVTRNGTTLVAPLVQIPSGWLSRMVITNQGSSAAAYTVRAYGETGNTVTLTGAAASGSVPATGVTIVDLPTLMTATGTNRGSLILTVAGTNGNISGVYQIVNPTGNLSNYVMDNTAR